MESMNQGILSNPQDKLIYQYFVNNLWLNVILEVKLNK